MGGVRVCLRYAPLGHPRRRLLALVPAFAVAAQRAAQGTVERRWISTTSGGDADDAVLGRRRSALYANFIWKRPPTAGQALEIAWHDPAGTLRAAGRDKTIKSDKEGTRLYAWVAHDVVKDKPGHLEAPCSSSAACVAASTSASSRRLRVRVTVRLFAALRERAGTGRRELELPEGARAGDVWPRSAIGDEPPGLAYAVNQDYAERSATLLATATRSR